MKRISLKAVTTEAKLLLIGIPVLIWTLIPIYHLFLFAISERDVIPRGFRRHYFSIAPGGRDPLNIRR